jgi:hypothetical protein
MTETIRSYGVIVKSTGQKTVRAQIVQQGRSYRVFEGKTLICETDALTTAHEEFIACRNRLMGLIEPGQNQPPLFS